MADIACGLVFCGYSSGRGGDDQTPVYLAMIEAAYNPPIAAVLSVILRVTLLARVRMPVAFATLGFGYLAATVVAWLCMPVVYYRFTAINYAGFTFLNWLPPLFVIATVLVRRRASAG